jgi:poly-gamma-glutamate synthesis protein (capsule biosynthesis protein)
MKLKRKIATLLILATLSTTFVACDKNSSSNLENTPPDYNNSITKEDESTLKNENNATNETENVTTTTEPEPEPKTYTVDLVAVGDNLIHTGIISAGKNSDGTYNYDFMYENITKEISQADIKIINQETMFVEDPSQYSGYPTFGSPYQIGDAIIKAGFNVVTHATNHTYDKGATGVLNTTSYWKKHPEVLMTGVYDSQESHDTISIMEVNNIKIAFLNYTYGLNGLRVPEDKKYFVNTLYDEDKIKSDLTKANELADFVIVLPHWGTEYVYEPTEYQISWARVFVENGADLIIGTHPHVVEPLDFILKEDGTEVPCYFSLGNYISAQDQVPRMLGAMAKVTIEMTEGQDAKIISATMEPTVTHISSDRKIYTTYMLKDYTEELASDHYLNKKGRKVSINILQELYDSIILK